MRGAETPDTMRRSTVPPPATSLSFEGRALCMKVVTVVTDPDNAWLHQVLEPSCAHHGLELVVLVSERPLALAQGGSYREKDRELASYLTTIPDDELVLFSDGYDAVMLAGPQPLAEGVLDRRQLPRRSGSGEVPQ